MITLKYCKTLQFRFVSHIDILRHMSRITRRAGIPVGMSQGFNPHRLLFFSPPMPLGIGSLCEYVTIDTDMSAEDALFAYNAAVPDGIKATAAFETPTSPNLAARIFASDYVFPVPYTGIETEKGFIITYEKKGEKISEDVADRIYSVFDAGGKLGTRLATGNVNLRPDRVASALRSLIGCGLDVTDIVKTAQYVSVSGETVSADVYLENKF